MSEPEGRHAASDATLPHPGGARRFGLAGSRTTRSVWFWTVPIVITLALLGALAAFYLGGILTPMTNLRHFPIAVVNEDAGPTGAQVVKGLLSGFDNDAYDVRVYLDGQADAGLSQALTMTAIGLAIGLLLGGIVTLIYDRRGYHRIPPGLEATSSPESTAGTELTMEPAGTAETTKYAG